MPLEAILRNQNPFSVKLHFVSHYTILRLDYSCREHISADESRCGDRGRLGSLDIFYALFTPSGCIFRESALLQNSPSSSHRNYRSRVVPSLRETALRAQNANSISPWTVFHHMPGGPGGGPCGVGITGK